ncbi:MAG: DUF1552 domain-containing protein [Planctomycetales bacterium]
MHFSRRQFLRAGGAVLALPALPSLAGSAAAKADQPAKKLVIMYVPNGLVRRCFIPGEENGVLPGFATVLGSEKRRAASDAQQAGTYPLTLTSTMQPLSEHAGDLTLITGLDRPYRLGGDAHEQGAQSYLTSMSPEQADKRGLRWMQGRTLDHVVGDAVGKSTPFKTLELSCNGFKQGRESPGFDNISWYDAGKVAPSIKDPQKLYRRLFSSNDFQEHMLDVTDLVLADAKSLQKKLGREDRRTMTEFMESIRGIEVRIERLQERLLGVDVQEPKSALLPRGEYIRLMGDLMIAALQMGITNVATLMIGPERWNASMLYEDVFDKPVQHHSMSHNQKKDGYKALQKIDLFHMQQYAYLLSRMKSVKESDGSSMLDNSIITCGVGLGDGATHQYFDLPLMIAGNAQGALKHGQHIQCANGTPISNVWLAVAQHMGVDIEKFSNSTRPFTELSV